MLEAREAVVFLKACRIRQNQHMAHNQQCLAHRQAFPDPTLALILSWHPVHKLKIHPERDKYKNETLDAAFPALLGHARSCGLSR